MERNFGPTGGVCCVSCRKALVHIQDNSVTIDNVEKSCWLLNDWGRGIWVAIYCSEIRSSGYLEPTHICSQFPQCLAQHKQPTSTAKPKQDTAGGDVMRRPL